MYAHAVMNRYECEEPSNIYHETMKARRKLHDWFLKEVKLISLHETLHLGNE
jgi:hypothetical protein